MENQKKIKRNTLIADFEDGGLNMIHLQQFNAYGSERIVSLQKEKILEISKIFSNPFWKDVFYSLYLTKPQPSIFKISYECISFDFFMVSHPI
jgi:hypothetical protein